MKSIKIRQCMVNLYYKFIIILNNKILIYKIKIHKCNNILPKKIINNYIIMIYIILIYNNYNHCYYE